MKSIFTLSTVIFSLVVFFNIAAQAQNAVRPNFAELEKTITDELKEKNAVGAAVAIVSGDKIVFAKGFGTANAETGQAITPQTLFQIGSITKIFTASLILGMVNDGTLKLDAPVGSYVKNLNPKLAKITLAQLLSHTGGIIDEPDEFGAGDESLMAGYIRSWNDDYALFQPGEVFSYSNSGFALAGLTAQEAGGKSYVDLMDSRIFAPLGMKSTTFRPTTAMTFPLAVGHAAKTGEKPQIVRPLAQDARLYPAGTFYSNLEDMSKFAIAFLNDGKIDGKQIINPNVFQQMSSPHGKQLSAADGTEYGYGVFMKTERGVRQLWHDGSMTGYVAQIKFVPEKHFAVIILGNTNNVVFSGTQEKALELIGSPKPPPESETPAALPISETAMKAYVGIYKQPNRWQIEIAVKDGKLVIREFNQELALTKIGENRFAFQLANAPRPLEIYVQPEKNGKSGFVHQFVWAFKKLN